MCGDSPKYIVYKHGEYEMENMVIFPNWIAHNDMWNKVRTTSRPEQDSRLVNVMLGFD